MKNGKSLVELAQEITRQSAAKEDYVADTREIGFGRKDGEWLLQVPEKGEFEVTEHAHKQLGAKMGIPSKYYDRMKNDAPQLLKDNVRHWMDNEPKTQMIRTLDNKARAVLSNRYRRIDNEQIAEAVLPALLENNSGIEIVSNEITDNRMYIQARFPKLEGEVKVGDAVQHGLIISNSEIGAGSLEIKPMIYRLVCTNGMVAGREFAEGKMKKTHLGRKVSAENYTLYSDETMQADDHALMLKIRDSIKGLSDPQLFFKLMEQMKQAATTPNVVSPVQAVEQLGKVFTFNQNESESILENLIRDRDYSKWGMLNAVTEVANEHASYDRAVELETIGGHILDMNGNTWKQIAEAA